MSSLPPSPPAAPAPHPAQEPLPFLNLDDDNHAQVLARLQEPRWLVACLCAAWCNTCGDYQPRFAQLARRFPNVQFVWIDIEDQAHVVGDLDVDNFPTLLIQNQDVVSFFGTMLPDTQLAERLLQSLQEQSPPALATQATGSPERRLWQRDCNLRMLLEQA